MVSMRSDTIKGVTYGLFLLVFLVVPIVLLAALFRRHIRRSHLTVLAMVCALAFVYTTPWDNYAAYKQLWSFDEAFVWGPPLWFGWLPLEEYLFYFAEAIFVILTLIGLASRVPFLRPEPDPEES